MQLMMLWETHRQGRYEYNIVSPGNYLDWKAQNTVFESIAAFRETRSVLTDRNHAEELGKQSMSAELLPMFGVTPIRGRLFTHDEDLAAVHSDSVLLISYRIWQSWFGGDPNIIGRRVQLNAMPRTIIGVMPPGFSFQNRAIDLWEPLGLNPAENYRKTQGRWMLTIARLKPGVTLAQAQAQMTAISQRLEASYPDFDKNWTVDVEPLRDSLVREVRRSLLILSKPARCFRCGVVKMAFATTIIIKALRSCAAHWRTAGMRWR
jgi:putative ABC transport system permease protein